MAAGIEAAADIAMPGPLLISAVAAGIWSGRQSGLLIGLLAGLLSSTIAGRDMVLYSGIGAASGMIAALMPHWFSRRHLLVWLVTAAVISGVIIVILALTTGISTAESLALAVQRGGLNALWIAPVYGIVLMTSPRRVASSQCWEYTNNV